MTDNLRRKCVKCGLSPNADDPNIKLHRFPKPGSTNMRRCEMWAKYGFPDKLWSSVDFQRKLYSEHRMLCNKHFRDSEFINIEEKKLSKHAVPDMIDFDENGKPSEYLYEPEILKRLDFNKSPAQFKPKISAANPGEDWMVVRPLQRSDYDKGFLQLLSQLTSVGNITRYQFDERFTKMKQSGGYYVTVIEDTRISKLIGAATLTIEQKFIHNCSVRGRLEDVVVNDTYRGKQLGKLIVVTVSLLAQELGCYKMSLDCKDKLIKFYETLGYKLEPGNSNAMNMRFEEPS